MHPKTLLMHDIARHFSNRLWIFQEDNARAMLQLEPTNARKKMI
jgi:hypothetical protein